MAKQGRAGPALGIAAIGFLHRGTVSLLGLTFLALPFRSGGGVRAPGIFLAHDPGPGDSGLSRHGSMLKAVLMALSADPDLRGTDNITGSQRFTFGFVELSDGFDLVPLSWASSASPSSAQRGTEPQPGCPEDPDQEPPPNRQDWAKSAWPILRGTVLGFFLESSGAGPVISSFVSYTVEKESPGTREKFGTGVIEGVAAPESATRLGPGAFIPLLTLGIPPT